MLAAPETYGLSNAQYQQCRWAVADAMARQAWSTALTLHERPYRLPFLVAVEDRITDDDQWWNLVADVWIDSENIWQNAEAWEQVLTGARPGREALMSEEDRACWETLPETVTLYRGYDGDEGTREGWSWTTEYDTAAWFARRSGSDAPEVVTATVARADVIAVFTRRGEAEIVADPATVVPVETEYL